MSPFKLQVFHQNRILHLTIDTETTLLDALRQLPFEFRKACINGACGICRCRLQNGKIDYRDRTPTGLWDTDIADSYILPCIAYATTNLKVTNIRTHLKKD
jgi:ferredoxin